MVEDANKAEVMAINNRITTAPPVVPRIQAMAEEVVTPTKTTMT